MEALECRAEPRRLRPTVAEIAGAAARSFHDGVVDHAVEFSDDRRAYSSIARRSRVGYRAIRSGT